MNYKTDFDLSIDIALIAYKFYEKIFFSFKDCYEKLVKRRDVVY